MTSGGRVVIINYGMGNLNSVQSAFAYLGCDAMITSDKAVIVEAGAIVLPGVGAFGEAMRNLENLDLIDVLTRAVMERNAPFLGICLGMQLLALDSTENGYHRGLGWIEGSVIKLPESDDVLLPHVGWNDVHIRQREPLFPNIANGCDFFFDHTYHFQAPPESVAATCTYGEEVVAAIHSGNIMATQFHPEKSQTNGLRILRNFLNFQIDHAKDSLLP